MVLLISLLGTMAFFILLVLAYRMYQSPSVQANIRLKKMVAEAETVRAGEQAALEQRQEEAARAQLTRDNRPFNELSFRERVIEPLIKSVENAMQFLAPSGLAAMLELRILRAGKQNVWSVQRFVTYWVLSLIIGLLLAILLVNNMKLAFVQQVVIIFLGGVLGAGLPFAILNTAVQKHKKVILRQLPDFLDLLCVSVQAGLSFDGALSKIVGRMKGELIDEFRHMQNDVKLGMTRQESLTDMAYRCDMEEVYLFATSIIQAEKLGTSMSKTIQNQADNMRERHRQYVRAAALKAPVKIMFPMVFFIFPAMFVILLFPALISISQAFGR